MKKLTEFKTDVFNDWCPGCGDFGIINSIQMALAEMNMNNNEVALFTGIGCSGKTAHFVNVNGMHVPHGRLLTYAQGAKITNPHLTVIAAGGDGDGLGIGMGHFIAAGRRNVDMTYLIFDNGVYGLTKGQASPTLHLGVKTKSIPTPNINYSVNAIGIALASGFTFIARGYTYDVRHLKEIIKKAISHNGLSFVQVLQPCPTYNDVNTRDWYAGKSEIESNNLPRSRLYKLEESGFDPIVHHNNQTELEERLTQALIKSLEGGNKIPIGIFYQNEFISTYERRISGLIDRYISNSPALQTISKDKKSKAKISKLIDELVV